VLARNWRGLFPLSGSVGDLVWLGTLSRKLGTALCCRVGRAAVQLPHELRGRCTMSTGSAIVRIEDEGLSYEIEVTVEATTPSSFDASYLRCPNRSIPPACQAGALSGARYASRRVNKDGFGVEIIEVDGDTQCPRAGEGSAVAAMFATWAALDFSWESMDRVETWGWLLVRQSSGR